MTKQITIYDLLPLLKKGWVAMDDNGRWWWYIEKPKPLKAYKMWQNQPNNDYTCISTIEKKDIAPFDGDWKDSLIKVGGKMMENTDVITNQGDCQQIVIDNLNREIERLQKQLDEANLIISDFRTYDFTINDECAEEYQVKYGIKGKRIYTNMKAPKEYYAWRKKVTKSLEKKLKSGGVK